MDVLVALGGGVVGAAATAFLQWLVKRQKRPRLCIDYKDDDLSPPFSESDPDEGRVSYLFARPRVRGENGKDSAHRVQVILTGCKRLDAEEPKHAELLLGRPFKWSDVNSNELGVPPGICRRFDLVHLRRRASSPVDEPLELTLDIYPKPIEDRHRLSAGQYLLDLALVAQDLPSQYFHFRIAVADGQGNELRPDQLRVTPLTREDRVAAQAERQGDATGGAAGSAPS
jgi:hypothetical protein